MPDHDAVETVATALSFCLTHSAIGHESLAWEDCRFRQLFYFDPEPADPWEATDA